MRLKTIISVGIIVNLTINIMERDFQVVKIFMFRIRIIIFDEVLGYGVKFNFN
jgi:hypothetical protein